MLDVMSGDRLPVNSDRPIVTGKQTTNKQTSSVCSDLTVMIPRSTITRAQLLAEAAELVQSAVKRGLMSYPHGTKFQANGTPIPNLDGGLPITIPDRDWET